MEVRKLEVIATSMIAFSTFLAGLFAMLYYFYQVKNISILQAFVLGEIYIVLNLSFLYTLKRLMKW